MVVVADQILGQLVPAELVVAGHPPGRVRLLEDHQVPVRGALGQAPALGQDLAGGQGPIRSRQNFDECATACRVALADSPQAQVHELMEVLADRPILGHVDLASVSAPAIARSGSRPRRAPARATTPNTTAATSTIVAPGARPQMRAATS